jgi:hypothetical protein
LLGLPVFTDHTRPGWFYSLVNTAPEFGIWELNVIRRPATSGNGGAARSAKGGSRRLR